MWTIRSLAALGALIALTAAAPAATISGDYVEARTCDVYTGPCFANAETGLTGNSAVAAWSIDSGQFRGVDLSGLKVVVALRTNRTLKDLALEAPSSLRAVIMVDERASEIQRRALAEFAVSRFSPVKLDVVRVDGLPIEMSVDHVDMVARIKVGHLAELVTREVRQGDCVCTNEIIFYPPLCEVDNFAPAVVVRGGFQGSGLQGRWNSVNARSAFLATFAY